MAELKALNIKRGIVKGSLSRFRKFLGSGEGIDLTELETRLDRVIPLLAEFQELQFQIFCLDEDPNLQSSTDLEEFESLYYSLVSEARNLLSARQEQTAHSTNPLLGVHANNLEAPPKVAKLPQITLPSFHGGYELYFSFKQKFHSLVNKRTDIDETEKFCYLQSALKGEALSVIEALEITSRNYSKAWELLDQRFDNKRRVVGRHLGEIFSIEKIDKESSFKIRKLVDTALRHYRALESLDLPVQHWDAPLVFYLQQRLDTKTLREWEGECGKDTIPTFTEFMDFLQAQAGILEALETPKDKLDKNKSSTFLKQSGDKRQFAASTVTQTSGSPSNQANQVCPACKYRHKIFYCRKFLALSVPERLRVVTRANLCINCLRGDPNHTAEECPKPHCKNCTIKHNSLLHSQHASESTSAKSGPPNETTANSAQAELSQSSTATQDQTSTVLLSTAMVKVLDKSGIPHNCRVLLDCGSQLNFVSEKMAQILGLPSYKKSSSICGIGGSRSSGHRGIQCQIHSTDGSFRVNLECVVLPRITLDLPTTQIDISHWKIPTHIMLADPAFFTKSPIHMLIGAAEFFNILGSSQIPLGPGYPSLQHTKLGWVVSGKVVNPSESDTLANLELGCSLVLEDCIRQFWESEEVEVPRRLNPEEQACEDIFCNTTTQDSSGKFEVYLPIKSNIGQLEDNKETAMKRFFSLERKLSKNQDLRDKYVSFMREYERLGHMSPASDDHEPFQTYYMPHHGVVNEHSSTTKLRVVFDGSCKSGSSGLALNDVLMVGPTLQEDLVSILMRFRQHRYVMTADITKMYRQINICEEHRTLQRIFWRESPNDPLQIYNLNTVTYGTSPASYLSTRCLKEIAEKSSAQYPQGSIAVNRDFYVDDFLGGCESIEDALTLQQQVIAVTKAGGFDLHKWCANDVALIKNIDSTKRESKYELNPQIQAAIKTLGVWWNPSTDKFSFSIHTSDSPHITKRSILSEVARVFDPMGLLGPVILQAKLFLKQLWIENVDWDTPLNSVLKDEWIEFRAQLNSLQYLEVPRRAIQDSTLPVELHGFCDSSEKAYGAAVYLRSVDASGNYHVELLCSKSRVAPVKALSIPRLELCGALILSRLVRKCVDSLSLPDISCHLWTDSTVALAWITQPSSTWKTFVSNRVSEIHSLTKDFDWHHVPGSDNPSDLLSRGLKPVEIHGSHLWWHGPTWLSESQQSWPTLPVIPSIVPEMKLSGVTMEDERKIVIDFKRFSKLNRLINSVVYSLRFIDHLPNHPCIIGPIYTDERERALRSLIKLIQREAFGKDVKRLQMQQAVSKKGPLAPLNPILDKNGIVRVGGRLEKANLDYDQKHQIVLPSDHHFTFLLINHFHHKNLHAGPQLLLASIRQQYWPIRGKSLIRKVFHACTTCFRHQPRSVTQIMGDLPAERVQPARPFVNSGVDFCGPFIIKSGTLRQSKLVKAYAALFICLATKAVHLELVSDMSTPAFINALKRFFARRGVARNMYSDHGSNFIGASRELNQYIAGVFKNPQFQTYTAAEQVVWHFIPPRTPHMGGIWESAIKSLKFHLKRVVGGASLTFEEMTTVLAMVEACLNSRPLLPLSNNPHDLTTLTPGHFLIGDAMTALVEPDLRPYKEGTLKRWARLQRIYQHFWDRWSHEYLSSLQSRQKWQVGQSNLPVDKLVLIKEDNVPPLKWHLARVIAVHPGADGRVRVASVRTIDGIFKRHVSKLCPLPVSEDNSSQEPKLNNDSTASQP